VNSIIIKLEGITAHAGEPEKGINPAMAIASIITNSILYSG
jgi:metal-dependent amidase/aminoacylase/carboxypeptidase family protein